MERESRALGQGLNELLNGSSKESAASFKEEKQVSRKTNRILVEKPAMTQRRYQVEDARTGAAIASITKTKNADGKGFFVGIPHASAVASAFLVALGATYLGTSVAFRIAGKAKSTST